MVLEVEAFQPNNSIQEGDFVKFSPTNQVYKSIYLHEEKTPKKHQTSQCIHFNIHTIFSLHS